MEQYIYAKIRLIWSDSYIYDEWIEGNLDTSDFKEYIPSNNDSNLE